MAGVPRDPRGRVILTVGPALLGGLAGGAEPGADLGPGVAAGAQALDRLGAGDGDRTRTISLGIWTVLERGLTCVPGGPRVTVRNLCSPGLMAR